MKTGVSIVSSLSPHVCPIALSALAIDYAYSLTRERLNVEENILVAGGLTIFGYGIAALSSYIPNITSFSNRNNTLLLAGITTCVMALLMYSNTYNHLNTKNKCIVTFTPPLIVGIACLNGRGESFVELVKASASTVASLLNRS